MTKDEAELLAETLEHSTEREIHTSVAECQLAARCVRAVLKIQELSEIYSSDTFGGLVLDICDEAITGVKQ